MSLYYYCCYIFISKPVEDKSKSNLLPLIDNKSNKCHQSIDMSFIVSKPKQVSFFNSNSFWIHSINRQYDASVSQ